MYDVATGLYGTLREAEQLVFRDGRIAASKLVYDTYPIRKGQ